LTAVLNARAILVVGCAGTLVACSNGQPAEEDYSRANIANIENVKSSFGPGFKLTSVAPAGIDPRMLKNQALPPGITIKPPDCAETVQAQVLPEGLTGNMAATLAEGEGTRYVAIAVETSEPVPVKEPDQDCRKVGFTGRGMHGLVETVESPHIDGVKTSATHRVLQTTAGGKPRTGELYNYVASFGKYIVIVTANPLVLPDKPVAPVNTQRARDLLTAAVADVKG
jgi:hypothetical protein